VIASIGGGILRGVLVVPADTRDQLTINCGGILLYFKRTGEKISVTTQIEGEGFVERLPVYDLVGAKSHLGRTSQEEAENLLQGK